MMILAAIFGHMIGAFLGRVLCDWLFREKEDKSVECCVWYRTGFDEGYRLGKGEEE